MTYAHLQGLHSLREFYSKEKCENLKNDNFDPELILWLSNKIMKSTKWALADKTLHYSLASKYFGRKTENYAINVRNIFNFSSYLIHTRR